MELALPSLRVISRYLREYVRIHLSFPIMAYTEYRENQKREKDLQTVKANTEEMLRLQEPEHEMEHMKDRQEL